MKIFNVNGVVLFEDGAGDMRETLVAAIRQGVPLPNADLRGLDLSRLDLSNAVLPNCNCCRTDFNSCCLLHAELQSGNLHHVDFDGAFLVGANFSGANLHSASFDRCLMYQVDLTGADLTLCSFKGVDLSAVHLEGVHGNFSDSHELLAEIIIRSDSGLKAVAAMVAGRKVGCWREYMDAVYCIFGEEIVTQIRRAFIPYPHLSAKFNTLLEDVDPSLG